MLLTFITLAHVKIKDMRLFSTLPALTLIIAAFVLSGCGTTAPDAPDSENDWTPFLSDSKGAGQPDADGFVWQAEQFADFREHEYRYKY